MEREGNCQYLLPTYPDEYDADGNRIIAALLAPYVKDTYDKTTKQPAASFEEVRMAVVLELLGVTEAKARVNLSADEQATIEKYLEIFFHDDVEGHVRDTTGSFLVYSGKQAVVKALFSRQSFVATTHHMVTQRFQVSVVSEYTLAGPNQPRKDWFDSGFFQFTDESTANGPPLINKLYFSFHN